MKINMILAETETNHIIGRGNEMAWRFSPDLKHFQTLTDRWPVIVGPTTAIGMPKFPLKNRPGGILSRTLSAKFGGKPVEIINFSSGKMFVPSGGFITPGYNPASAFVLHNIVDAKRRFSQYDEIWFAGGAGVYKHILAEGIIETIYRTVLPEGYVHGDNLVRLDDETVEMMSEPNFNLVESCEYVLHKELNYYYLDKLDGKPFDSPTTNGPTFDLKEKDTPFDWFRTEKLVRADLYKPALTLEEVLAYAKEHKIK